LSFDYRAAWAGSLRTEDLGKTPMGPARIIETHIDLALHGGVLAE